MLQKSLVAHNTAQHNQTSIALDPFLFLHAPQEARSPKVKFYPVSLFLRSQLHSLPCTSKS